MGGSSEGLGRRRGLGPLGGQGLLRLACARALPARGDNNSCKILHPHQQHKGRTQKRRLRSWHFPKQHTYITSPYRPLEVDWHQILPASDIMDNTVAAVKALPISNSCGYGTVCCLLVSCIC